MTSSSNEKGPRNDVGFQFEIIYKDIHLLEIRISAWNGRFGGTADVYVGLDHINETTNKLQGFPFDPSDIREVSFATPMWIQGLNLETIRRAKPNLCS